MDYYIHQDAHPVQYTPFGATCESVGGDRPGVGGPIAFSSRGNAQIRVL